jgi:DNA-binding MarR family transcriptional regulator
MAMKHPSSLQAHLGYWLRFVSNRVSETFRASVEARGVTLPEWVALRTLYGAEGLTQGTLTNALGMTKGAVSKIVSRLDEKGLILRKGDPDDARMVVLQLSKSGKLLVPELARLADENDKKFFSHLSPEKKAFLREILEETVNAHAMTEVPTR